MCDGNAGGQKFVIHEAQWALLCSSYTSTHFTVLRFTSAQGDPVCCIIMNACASSYWEACNGLAAMG